MSGDDNSLERQNQTSSLPNLSFDNFKAEVVKHEACQHKLFSYVAEEAKETGLTPAQFDVFRQGMLSRISPTITSITQLANAAASGHDDQVFITAVQNLIEEGGFEVQDGKIVPGKTHRNLGEQAFNSLAKHAFNLEPVTMKESEEHPRSTKERVYHIVTEHMYEENPVLTSWLQERASGGDGKEQKGMMGDLFELFNAYRSHFPEDSFEKEVLPWFQAHIEVIQHPDLGYQVVLSENSVEYQHGQRAEADIKQYLNLEENDVDSLKKVLIDAKMFLDTQADFFNDILDRVHANRRVGTAIPAEVSFNRTMIDGNSPGEIGGR